MNKSNAVPKRLRTPVCGPGGFDCPCCSPGPRGSKARAKAFRSAKHGEKRAAIREELEAMNDDIEADDIEAEAAEAAAREKRDAELIAQTNESWDYHLFDFDDGWDSSDCSYDEDGFDDYEPFFDPDR